MTQHRIRELDEAGRQKTLYVARGEDSVVDRVDAIRTSDNVPLAQRALAIFLPTGYPNTVSSDYTAYHIYNSLQAFSSSIAGLLASRAVLQGLGVGDQQASATNAMLLTVLQESMGRVATIVFAHRVGTAIEPECKMYRLLADVLNDAAMVFDCLSPLLPKLIRVPLLGASSVFRAMCGVAGGSSKATLSAHFAEADNIGELSAKDSSQETVVSLLGMWVGGVVVSHATSTIATWIWLLLLLVVHLSMNYMAVKSVSMRSINRQRASIIFSSLLDNGPAPTPDQVSRQEHIFENSEVLRWKGSRALGKCEMGVSFDSLIRRIGNRHHKTGSVQGFRVNVTDFLDVFANEQYLLWIDAGKRRALIVLCKDATVHTQIKAWSHALRAMQCIGTTTKIKLPDSEILDLIQTTLKEHNVVFEAWISQLQSTGWNTSTPAIEIGRGNRIALEK